MVNCNYTDSKVLYLDSDTKNLAVSEINFSNNYQILFANNKLEAFEVLKENEIKVVIVDYFLPDKVCLDLVKEVNNLYPNLVCIVLTTYSDNLEILKAINNVNVFRFMIKPWREFDVIQTLNKAIEYYDSQKENQNLKAELTAALNKVEECNQLKSLFLSNIPHEIRTPLNGIVGFCNLISNRIKSDNSLSNMNYIIQKSSDQLIEVVENLLTASELNANENEQVENGFSLKKCLQDLYNSFKDQTLEKGIEISIKGITDKGDIIVKADKLKLFEVFKQLLRNAIKFTNTGCIEFGLLDEELFLFYVKDSGVGIDNRNKGKIFESFWKGVNNVNTEIYRGSGLGLSIVSEYISRVNGKIWVDSELNNGSTFFFVFPFEKHLSNN